MPRDPVGGDSPSGAQTTRPVSRSLRRVLRSPRPTRGRQPVHPGPAERQRTEIDAADGRAAAGETIRPPISACSISSRIPRGRTTKVWTRLRAELPVRRGVVLVDETGFPKHGEHSVAVARQYCGALGKIANCQVAVSTALLAEQLAWPTTMELYLPEDWAEDADRRARADIPRTLRFRPKWRIALDARPASAGGRAADRRRPRRRRLRQRPRLSDRRRSHGPAVCRRRGLALDRAGHRAPGAGTRSAA